MKCRWRAEGWCIMTNVIYFAAYNGLSIYIISQLLNENCSSKPETRLCVRIFKGL